MECGWTKRDLIDTLETRRTAKNHEWHTARMQRVRAERKTIRENTEVRNVNQELAQYGY